MNGLERRLGQAVVFTLVSGYLCLPCTAHADCVGKAPGDMDCNGTINTDDIHAWMRGLRNPSAYVAQYGQRPSGLGSPDQLLLDFDDAEWFLCVVENGSHKECEGAIIAGPLLTNSAVVPEPGSVCLVLTMLIWTMSSRFRLLPAR